MIGISRLLDKLGSSEYHDRAQTSEDIAVINGSIYDDYLPNLAQRALTIEDPEIRLRLIESIRKIYRSHILSCSKSIFRMELRYFIINDRETITSQSLIITLSDGYPARRAGFRLGDVIIEYDGESYLSKNSTAELKRYLSTIDPGEMTKFIVHRNRSNLPFSTVPKTRRITVAACPASRAEIIANAPPPRGGFPKVAHSIQCPRFLRSSRAESS